MAELNTYLDVGVQCMVASNSNVFAGLPLETALSCQDVVSKNLSIMTPFLDAQSATRRVGLVAGRTAHDFGGELHGGGYAHKVSD